MLIELESVSVSFDAKTVLDNINLSLDQKRIGVIGLNGSGKSTFARLLNGLIAPTTGTVTVGDINPATNPKAARQQTGFVFSNPDVQIIMPTVLEDVAFTLRSSKLSKDEVRTRALAVLQRFGIEDLADQAAHSLSSGQKQLLAISAIMIGEPKLIVADEPTALLDLANTRLVSRVLLEQIEQQVVLITHDLQLAANCDILIRFADAKLVEVGEPAAVISAYVAENA